MDSSGAKIENDESSSLLVVVEETEAVTPGLEVVELGEIAPAAPVNPAQDTPVGQPAAPAHAGHPPIVPGSALSESIIGALAEPEAPVGAVGSAHVHAPTVADTPAVASAPSVPHAEAEPLAAGQKPRRGLSLPRGLNLPMAALLCAAVASLLSSVGIIVASRTVARNNAMLAEIQAHQAKMQRLDQLIDEVDGLQRQQKASLAQMERVIANRPVSVADLQGAMGALQVSIGKSQSGTGTLALIRDGQSEIAERIGIIYRRLERLEEKMPASTAARPTARPAH